MTVDRPSDEFIDLHLNVNWLRAESALWDAIASIGLRPISPLLLKIVGKLTEDARLSTKTEWLETLRPFVRELWALDTNSAEHGGFHFVRLGK